MWVVTNEAISAMAKKLITIVDPISPAALRRSCHNHHLKVITSENKILRTFVLNALAAGFAC